MVNVPPIYGDDWGMVYYCVTHIIHRLNGDITNIYSKPLEIGYPELHSGNLLQFAMEAMAHLVQRCPY